MFDAPCDFLCLVLIVKYGSGCQVYFNSDFVRGIVGSRTQSSSCLVVANRQHFLQASRRTSEDWGER